MFKKEDCCLTGIFIKTHGVKGELVLKKENNVLEEYDKESVLIDIDGGLVPFFISPEGVNQRSSTTLRVKLDDVDSEENSLRFVGCRVYVLKKDAPALQDDDNVDTNLLTGFSFIDEKHGRLGIIERVLDYSGNILLQIFVNEKEILIPLIEENVLDVNEDQKTITMKTPDGLLDMYF